MMKLRIGKAIFWLLLFMSTQAIGQLTFRNQFEYTYWEEYNRKIIENWTDVTYQREFVQLGMRYEINHPPDPFIFPQPDLLNEYELTFGYAEFEHKNLSARVGDYYAMFGRGLVLRTYDDRNLRVDNNIRGLKLNFSGSSYKLKALAGKMRDKYNRRDDMIYGFDGEVNPLKNVHVGGSYLLENDTNDDQRKVWSTRVFVTRDLWDIYAEIARPDWMDDFSAYIGLNAAYSRLTLTAEYKDYHNLSFKNSRQTEYNAAPSLTRQHVFSLLNRHPHALNQNDEKGYQIELTYLPDDYREFIVNHSQTFTHNKQRIFEEFYGEIHRYFGDVVDGRLAAAWNFDFTTSTKNITPIADVSYNLTDRDQIHTSYQHQHTINTIDKSEYDTELLLVEYSRSPNVSFAVVGEYTNKNQLRNVNMDQNTWLHGIVTFSFWRNQQLSVLYGSRQAGFVCVGGICRYEPEFEGLEIKLVNRF